MGEQASSTSIDCNFWMRDLFHEERLPIQFWDSTGRPGGGASELTRLTMPSSFSSRRNQHLAELLVHYRLAAGLKQSDVADILGKHQPLITNMENDQRRIDVVELLELAEIIGFAPHKVLDELLKTPNI